MGEIADMLDNYRYDQPVQLITGRDGRHRYIGVDPAKPGSDKTVISHHTREIKEVKIPPIKWPPKGFPGKLYGVKTVNGPRWWERAIKRVKRFL